MSNPELNGVYTNSLRAGWALMGLQNVIDEIKQAYPDVQIEEYWSYRLFDRKVEFKITGRCAKVLEAAVAVESIHP